MFQSRRHSAPPPVVSNAGDHHRKSFVHRFSVQIGLASDTREAFTVDEAKSYAATDIALRIGNKNPSLPCTGDRRYTPLHVAASLGKEDVMKMILAYDNTSLNAVARLKLTPLIVAVSGRQWKVVPLLLAAGADVTMKDSSGRTAYDIAIEEKAPETILQLLFPTKKLAAGDRQRTPFSSVVVNESTVTVTLREDL